MLILSKPHECSFIMILYEKQLLFYLNNILLVNKKFFN